jgi:fructose-1,6-bisphosphatase I
VLRHERGTAPETADYLQPGRSQAAAGYAIYGPSTMLVLTVGKGTHGFTLDREIGNFVLTHPNLQIAAETGEFAIDIGNERFWEPPVQRYVRECKAGSTGVRAHDFNMRWVASLVAEVHRILMRGGVLLHPLDLEDRAGSTTLRLLYEANPLALLVEQAGGLASTGREPVLDFEPVALHQGVPVIVGSRSEVERIVRYHREYDTGVDQPYVSPLFNERSLFRAEARV